MVEELIGPDIALWISSFFAKPAKKGSRTPWHQDVRYWPIRPLATCSVWIAVDPSTTENGCLRVIPDLRRQRRTTCSRPMAPSPIDRIGPRRGMTLRYMPTTSVFDRDLAVRQSNRRGGLLDLTERTLYLVRGEDRSGGRNDYRVRS